MLILLIKEKSKSLLISYFELHFRRCVQENLITALILNGSDSSVIVMDVPSVINSCRAFAKFGRVASSKERGADIQSDLLEERTLGLTS